MKKTKMIVYVGLYLAMYYVLDVLTHMIPILKMPQGGSASLSAVALCLASYHLGYQGGILVGLLSVFVQFLTGDVYYVSFVQFLIDYLLAFGVYGICCLFPNWKNLYSGVLFSGLIRLYLHTLSGCWFYQTPFLASLAYNGPYMLATTLIALIIVPMLDKRLKILIKW